MLEKLKKGLEVYFTRQPLDIKYILLLTVSVFLPLYVTVPVIMAAGGYFILNRRVGAVQTKSPYFMLYALIGVIALAVPLLYRNYLGFACGILMIFFFVLEYNIRNVMTDKLFDRICSISYGMSFLCAAVAIAEKLFGLQVRVTALTNNANYYAFIIELLVIVCAYKYVVDGQKTALVAIAANIAALILTECRSAWIAMLIGLFVFSRILKHKKMTRLLYVLAAVIAVALYFDPHIVPRYDILGDSMTDRFHIWSASFRDFLNNPVFGRGLLAFFQVSGNRITPHAHNLYIDLLESFGITGTAVFLIFFFTVVKQLVIAFKYGGEKEKLHAALSSAVLVVTLVHGLVDTPIMGFQTGLFLTLMLALRPKVSYSTAPKKAYNANYALGYKR